jgi:hypothetical protein
MLIGVAADCTDSSHRGVKQLHGGWWLISANTPPPPGPAPGTPRVGLDQFQDVLERASS